MASKFVNAIFGDYSKHEVKKLQKTVDKINATVCDTPETPPVAIWRYSSLAGVIKALKPNANTKAAITACISAFECSRNNFNPRWSNK